MPSLRITFLLTSIMFSEGCVSTLSDRTKQPAPRVQRLTVDIARDRWTSERTFENRLRLCLELIEAGILINDQNASVVDDIFGDDVIRHYAPDGSGYYRIPFVPAEERDYVGWFVGTWYLHVHFTGIQAGIRPHRLIDHYYLSNHTANDTPDRKGNARY